MHRARHLSLHVDGRCTGLPVHSAARFWSRAAGLLFASPDAAAVALELRPCRAVHTWGMRRPIDVVFVAGDGRVIDTVRGLAPWRLAWRRQAVATWELPAGSCETHGVDPGASLSADVIGPVAAPVVMSRALRGATPVLVSEPRPCGESASSSSTLSTSGAHAASQSSLRLLLRPPT